MRSYPISTYRLQLHAAFGFAKARAIADYLDALGVTDVYSSPLLKAERGSTHGYNTVDVTEFNPEMGTADDYRAWSDALMRREMGTILDMVPNHMGIGSGENAWWNDVLENGPCALSAECFDIEWDPPKPGLKDKVLLPILGAQYGEVLERGELSIVRQGGCFFVRYFEHCLPVSPPSLIPVLEAACLRMALPADSPHVQELQSITTALRHLPTSCNKVPEARAERAREKEVIKRRTDVLCGQSGEVARAIDDATQEMNGVQGQPKSFDALDAFLREQNYRLSFWRVATEEINFRRFFDVNNLAAIRMEVQAVFDRAHDLIFKTIREGRIQGLRLDHTDGLYDPLAYFIKLKNAEFSTGSVLPRQPLYVIAEKILARGEQLPKSWPIDGTTGYDFLSQINALWVDASAETRLTSFYAQFTGDDLSFEEHAQQSKLNIMRSSLSSEIYMLAQGLERIAEGNRRSRDFTFALLRLAIVETIAAFPVYRTYIREDGSREAVDEGHISRAIRIAKRRNPEANASVFDFLREILLLRVSADLSDEQKQSILRFTMRFQQITGPIMAKGLEDTAFYRYNRLVSLNEVGGHPGQFGESVAEFHQGNSQRLHAWPHAMITTSTHDTKRGEDVRARISALSEAPDLWEGHVLSWGKSAPKYKVTVDDEPAPSASDEYMFYQTAFGAWPLDESGKNMDSFSQRMAEYMEKATKEAKLRTAWINPNEDYDVALRSFVTGMLRDEVFVSDMRQLVQKLAKAGASNSLAQLLLKLTSPGIVDTYQGNEIWNLCLVDPDNRRPVDYDHLRELLDRVRRGKQEPLDFSRRVLDAFHDGTVKMYVTHTVLQLRKKHPRLFLEGDYEPLAAGDNAIAFVRQDGSELLVTVVPRLSFRLTQGQGQWPLNSVWGDRELELPLPCRGLALHNVFTGQRIETHAQVPLRTVFNAFPVALLVKPEMM